MSKRLEERLRRAARTYRRLGNYTAEDIFLKAADAIRELQAENDRLRQQLADVAESMGHVEERHAKTFEVGERWMAKAARFEADNAKLRELAAGIGHLLFPLDVDYCATCPRDDINHPCPVHTVKGGECLYETDLRELGVEVE